MVLHIERQEREERAGACPLEEHGDRQGPDEARCIARTRGPPRGRPGTQLGRCVHREIMPVPQGTLAGDRETRTSGGTLGAPPFAAE